MSIILKLSRREVIRKLTKARRTKKSINSILEDLGLEKTGVPEFKNAPKPPKSDAFIALSERLKIK